MADLSPIITLFGKWEEKYRRAGDMPFENEVATGLFDECRSLEKRILAIPASSRQDLAAKLIVCTRYGDCMLDDRGKGGVLDEAIAILAVREHPDAELIELGRQFEATRAEALKLERQGKLVRKAFIAKHSEAIKLMKAIHRTKATTLEGVAVKLNAVPFDLYDFQLEPKGGDVAEVQLLRLCKQTRELVKKRGGSCA